MAADLHWSVRTLKAKIDSMLYERTAIAKQPEEANIRVAEYMTQLPDRKLLESRFRKAIEIAKENISRRQN